MRLSPALSSLGSRTSQAGGVDGGGDGGGEEKGVGGSDQSPAAPAAGVGRVGGGDGGKHDGGHTLDADHVPSAVGDITSDVRVDRGDPALRRRTESDIIQEMDQMRLSIERRSSDNGADEVRVDRSGESVSLSGYFCLFSERVQELSSTGSCQGFLVTTR